MGIIWSGIIRKKNYLLPFFLFLAFVLYKFPAFCLLVLLCWMTRWRWMVKLIDADMWTNDFFAPEVEYGGLKGHKKCIGIIQQGWGHGP